MPALRAEHPDIMGGERGRREVEVFKRKWLCECIGFLFHGWSSDWRCCSADY